MHLAVVPCHMVAARRSVNAKVPAIMTLVKIRGEKSGGGSWSRSEFFPCRM